MTEAEQLSKSDDDVVLVTGSSGCLGRQVVKLLLAKDKTTREIRCLDVVEASVEIKQENEFELNKWQESVGNSEQSRKKTIKYFQGDIRDINLIESILSDLRVTCIIHCGSKIDVWIENSEQNQEELESININGTENLLKCCIRFAVPKFIYVSSYETFSSYHTIYYATESTIPEPDNFQFGASGRTKSSAEAKVKQYANNKLRPYKQVPRKINDTNDFLNAIIVRYTPFYGENDRYFVTRYLKLAKFFSGKLFKFSNVWIRQQPIYVGNAAWALICAKNKMNYDASISGEDFHITDDTKIGDPFEFLQPFLECKGMRLSQTTLPGLPVWFLVFVFFWLRKFLSSLDVFNLFTKRGGRLEEAIEHDQNRGQRATGQHEMGKDCEREKVRVAKYWYDLITPQMFFFTINSLFLNRTKASLRLNYEPLYDPKDSLDRSLSWYRDHLEI